MIAHEMKVLKLVAVSLDGTKVKANANANASKHKVLSYEHANKLEAQIKSEVVELLKKADTADHADILDGMFPKNLNTVLTIFRLTAAAKVEIERHAVE